MGVPLASARQQGLGVTGSEQLRLPPRARLPHPLGSARGGLRPLLPPCPPVAAPCRGGSADFFTPPSAFIQSRQPFEPFWQLLPAPLSPADFWAAPEAAPALREAVGALLGAGAGGDGRLRAVNLLPDYK